MFFEKSHRQVVGKEGFRRLHKDLVEGSGALLYSRVVFIVCFVFAWLIRLFSTCIARKGYIVG